MRPIGEAVRLLRGARRCAAAAALLWPILQAAGARADDISDELTLGRIGATRSQPAIPYWSDRLAGAVDVSDQVTLGGEAGVTRYGSTPDSKPSSIFQLGLDGTWQPSDHIILDAETYLSPASSSVDRVEDPQTMKNVAHRDTTSSFGFGLGGEYDTAGDSDAESAIGVSGRLTSYSTTQAIKPKLKPVAMPVLVSRARETASLLQWRASASFTETLYQDTDLGVSTSYYFYGRSTTTSGYYSAIVFARLGVGDGVPVAPLLYSIRPNVSHSFGALRLSGYGQYGVYDDHQGSSAIGGLRAQYRFSHLIRAWLSANLQHDWLSGSDDLRILWLNAGARFVF